MPLPELLLIERIRALAGRTSAKHGKSNDVLAAIRKGIGDDCAVLAGSKTHDLLVTTDLCIEDVHFRLDWHPPESVGHRCLTRGLSDIAAMGGEPVAVFLSLGLPAHLPQKWADGFFCGFQQLAKRFAVTLAGGDLATNPRGVVADVVVLGRVPKGKAILRSGAHPGDLIYVTGVLGKSAEIIAKLTAQEPGTKRSPFDSAHYFPEPRLRVGQWLRRQRVAAAMIDISDGLSTDLGHVCSESGVAAELQLQAIPHNRSHALSPEIGAEEDTRGLVFALHGGEDYELLFTAHRSRKVPKLVAGVRVTTIGEIVRRKRDTPPLAIVHRDGRVEPLQTGGWEHFSSSGMRYKQ